MDAVRAFNNELSSLYETKPPVSRAKMGAVTRAAIKAIKFYKHVVQSVEKFVLKCKPEYKIPGLYVIDSVVRQSRHQFGGDKDVFGPRFTKNIVVTFQSLLKCSAEDRSRVVRVLNLWQKNTVFPIEVIQALLDMASDPGNAESVAAAQRIADNVVLAHQRSHGKVPSGGTVPSSGPAPSSGTTATPAPAPVPAIDSTAANSGPEESLMAQQSDIVNTVAKLLQQTGDGNLMTSGQDVQLQQLQLLQHQLMMHTELMSHKPQQTTPVIDNNLLAQIKLLTDQLLSKTDTPATTSGLPPPPPPPLPTMAVNAPEVPVGVGFVPVGEPRDTASLPHPAIGHEMRDNPNTTAPPIAVAPREMPKLAEPIFNKKLLDFDYGDSDDEDMDQNQNEEGVQQHQHPHHTHHHHHHHHQQPQQQQQLPGPGDVHKLLSDPTLMQHIHNVSSLKSDQLQPDMSDPETLRKQHLEQQQEQFNKEIEQQSQYSSYNQEQDIIVVEEQDDRDREYDRDRRRSRHSRDRSRSPKRRRHSRSRSRERRRSRDRHRRSRSRDYDRERQREKDRERKKKGLPPVKDKHISLCTTTLWFGHLAKYTTEDELRTEIENYGTIESIKMVPPRGCAFVNMTWRKEAAKALDRMKGLKLNSSALRVAWAPNMGVKESLFKDLWDVDHGVTYIPWSKLPADLTPLLDGAMIDEDTLPDHLKGTLAERPQQDREEVGSDSFNVASSGPPPSFGGQSQGVPSSQHLPLIPPPMMIPPPGSLPPPGIPIPPPSAGQMPLPGQIPLPGQNPPQGLPPSLLPPPGGPVSTPMSLPISLPRPPVASIPAPLAGSMSHGFPPGPPFRPPPSLRPGMPPPGPGMHPFTSEEGKDWSNDASIEDEMSMDEDDAGVSQGRGPGPLLGPPPMMRMDVPGGQPPLLGPRLLPPQDGPDGILPPQMPPGLMGPGPIGLRLGPRGLPPLPMENRFGSPVMRGMGPGGSPVRFVLGQRPSLVRPGGPFRLDNPRGLLGNRQSSPPRSTLIMDGPGPASSESGQADRGAGPNLPVNGRFPFGPGAPNFAEPPPSFGGATANKKGAGNSRDDDKSPAYGEEDSSPEYGDDFDDSEDNPLAAQDRNLCDDSQSNPKTGPKRGSPGTGLTKSGRVSRWSDHADNNDKSRVFQERLAGSNGLPSSTNTDTKSVPTHANQPVSEGISEG